MDANRFDTLAKWLVVGLPRRVILRLLAGGVLGGVFAPLRPTLVDAGECLDLGQTCKKADQCCSGKCKKRKGRRTGKCVDPCSFPYFGCDGRCLLAGACCPGTANDCTRTDGRWVCCTTGSLPYGCHNLDTDRFHCDQCGHECAENEVCCQGVCRLPPCPPD